MLDERFEPEQQKPSRADILAKARAAKAAKKAAGGDEKPVMTMTTHDEIVWREAMVAQIANGRCVSPQQLDSCSRLAYAYLELVNRKFP